MSERERILNVILDVWVGPGTMACDVTAAIQSTAERMADALAAIWPRATGAGAAPGEGEPTHDHQDSRRCSACRNYDEQVAALYDPAIRGLRAYDAWTPEGIGQIVATLVAALRRSPSAGTSAAAVVEAAIGRDPHGDCHFISGGKDVVRAVDTILAIVRAALPSGGEPRERERADPWMVIHRATKAGHVYDSELAALRAWQTLLDRDEWDVRAASPSE